MDDSTNAAAAEWLRSLAHAGARLRLDSREVKPGDIFCAVPGEHADGRAFIRVAEARGAAGVIYEAESTQRPEHYPLATRPVERLRERLGDIASRFYGDPSAAMTGVAVTGTNGKTTVTYWTSQLLTRLGAPAGVIGTTGVFFGGRQIPGPHLTTPDAASLQGIFADLRDAGARAFAMEASSVGLEQGRMTGTHFCTAVFTNLSRDHLDYHGTMEAYGAAKGLLFAWPGLKHAVLNAADSWSRRYAEIARSAGAEIWLTGSEGAAAKLAAEIGAEHALDAFDARPSGHGMRFRLEADGKAFEVDLPAIGLFNVENVLQAAAAAAACGMPLAAAVEAIPALTPPPGRMELFAAEGMPLGVVDFCHTPDALEKAIESLIPSARARGGRLWTVFGCGGDRDAGKRPIMGGIAARTSDRVVITSDNPRSEDPQAIVDQIAQGAQGEAGAASAEIIVDRREAIHHAVFAAAPEDIILVAGKGHECEQILKDGPHRFSDGEVLREAFNERRVRSR